ncbi:Dabb family protein [Sphingobium sp. CR2-8]|uniref:Dabb family protein n=1 Tax=Sphingobium sp. CR2-8 TaxID=1306534 RepID=UPI002DB627AF|nr:Dabb family protein [Sphingobium sp. CR2-8]MEC3912462.1 Dabb family protein [Sphingobium sp. CR2-8]
METSRREMAAMMALGGAGMALSPASAATPATQPKLVHHVFFWLKRPGNPADRDRLIAGLRTLRAIPVIRDLQIGVPASTEKRDVVDSSFDVSELMVFDNPADQKVYQDHPIHQAFVKACDHLWQRVLVYDMQVVPAAA